MVRPWRLLPLLFLASGCGGSPSAADSRANQTIRDEREPRSEQPAAPATATESYVESAVPEDEFDSSGSDSSGDDDVTIDIEIEDEEDDSDDFGK